MDMPSASPAHAYVEPGMRHVNPEDFVDINVGNQVVKVVIIGAASIVGASALSEAKEALVFTLTNTFGKYKATKQEDNILCIKTTPEKYMGGCHSRCAEEVGIPGSGRRRCSGCQLY